MGKARSRLSKVNSLCTVCSCQFWSFCKNTMALSTMRIALKPGLLDQTSVLFCRSLPATTTTMSTMSGATPAQQQMKEFWKKNQRLGRPSSPWVLYKPPLPMITSLPHRVTGIGMGVVLYGISFGLFLAPGYFPSYIAAVQAFNISPLIMWPAKTIVAFPLVYHYINGIRHLAWDVGYGYKLGTQYKTGYFVFATAAGIAGLIAGLSYMK